MGKGWLIFAGIVALLCLCLVCAGGAAFLYWGGQNGGGFPDLRIPAITPAASAQSSSSSAGTLRLIGGKPVTLDPALVEDTTSSEYVAKIFVGLVSLDNELRVRPELAERWEVSPDGKTYTFYLRADARFQDGRPVTAGDVKYSLERACDPQLGSNVAATYLGDIEGVRERLAGKAAEIDRKSVV